MNTMVERYEELYAMMSSSKDVAKMKVFGEAERWAFGKMAEKDPAMAQVWLDKLEPSMWSNYLSKREAEEIVAKFQNADGTHGAHWPFETFRNAVDGLGVPMSEEPYFNGFALWVVANMIYSDHAKSIAMFVPEEERIKFIYAMAVDKLKDEDKKHFVREYFDFD